MNKSYGNKLMRTIGWSLIAFLVLFIVGMMLGGLIGGGNILTPFLPSTWDHIFNFIN